MRIRYRGNENEIKEGGRVKVSGKKKEKILLYGNKFSPHVNK